MLNITKPVGITRLISIVQVLIPIRYKDLDIHSNGDAADIITWEWRVRGYIILYIYNLPVYHRLPTELYIG